MTSRVVSLQQLLSNLATLQSLPLHAIIEITAKAGTVEQRVLLLLLAADVVEPEAPRPPHSSSPHDVLLLKAPFSMPPCLVVEACSSAPPTSPGAGTTAATR